MQNRVQVAGIDHILVGAPNLDAGIAAFEKATGLTPLRGGRHPSRGTENALVSLGNHLYLEIIAPRADASDSDEFVKYLRALHGPSVVGWAVHVGDIVDAAARMQQAGFQLSKPQPGSRITPAGEKLAWVTLDVEKPQIETAPFFIQWGATTVHPSRSSPRCSFVSFRVEEPKAQELSRLLASINVSVDVRAAERSRMELHIRCGEREASFVSQGH